jgi:tripartite-type tricarboxylate transporter receptor subunit TctC
MAMKIRGFLDTGLALCVGAMLFAAPAHAQTFPSRTITLVCPFAPGGSADIMARLVGQKLAEALGATVVVENKPGAGSAVGSNFVARAKPDGHTLILLTGAYPAQAALTISPQFDPLKDIAMVSMISSYPFLVNVLPDAPYKTPAELIAHARANPGKLNYSTAGVGSIHHLSSELFNAMAGTEIVHIPTKGGNAAMTELLSGRSQVLFEAPTLSLPYIRSGKLRALAVTSRERYRVLPEVPTMAETLPGYEVMSFIGVGVTGGTPEPIVNQLNRALVRGLEAPETARRVAELGGDPQSGTPEDLRRFVEREYRKWRDVIEARKIERQ